jgi:hypothetical protein
MSLNLDAVVETSNEPTTEDRKKVTIEEDKYLGAKLHRINSDTNLRITLANFFAIVIAFWLLAVILILVGNNCNHYNLSDCVLNTLLTTTTIQVLGMMVIILWDLFPGGKDKTKNE